MTLTVATTAEEARRDEARALEDVAASLVARGWEDPARETELDSLAVRLFRHQAVHNPVAAAWWRRCLEPQQPVRGWRDVPPLPVRAFKTARVASFPRRRGEAPTFLSSGTASGSRSRVHVEDLRLYEAAVAAGFRRHALPDRERMRLLFLAPAPTGRRSSLLHMFGVVCERFGAAGSAFLGGGPQIARRLPVELARAVAADEPIFLLGAAFAFVHAIDALAGAGRRFALPPGSRLFVTGGFKGLSREVDPRELRSLFADHFALGPGTVHHEYGMAELASQLYALEEGPFVAPPWVRWRVLDPLTLAAVRDGEAGVLAIWDVANRSTCFALRTEDLVVAVPGGLRLLGREPESAPRGCSLEADRDAR